MSTKSNHMLKNIKNVNIKYEVFFLVFKSDDKADYSKLSTKTSKSAISSQNSEESVEKTKSFSESHQNSLDLSNKSIIIEILDVINI